MICPGKVSNDTQGKCKVTGFPISFCPQDDEDDSSTSLLEQKKPGYHAPVAILTAIPPSDEQVCVNVLCYHNMF